MPVQEENQSLSALQSAMLRGSATGNPAENLQQVEILFSAETPANRLRQAWTDTVEHTAALRAGFVFQDADPTGIRMMDSAGEFSILKSKPLSWETWLAEDRQRPLSLGSGLPWRLAFWPEHRKLVWTFHHALLDGRSITKILRAFLDRLSGKEDPGGLMLSLPQIPDVAEIAEALEFHRAAFADVDSKRPEFPGETDHAPATVRRSLGANAVARLEATADGIGVTAATLITWAWGQAVAAAAGADRAAVGQVRSGPPLPGHAGFSMNTVPLVIERATAAPLEESLLAFRKKLLQMRAIETVSPQDLPPGLFQETGGPWPGGVLMVEQATFQAQFARYPAIESIALHEYSGEPLLASAGIRPDLCLEVEVNGNPLGPRAATTLLDLWASVVTTIGENACALPTAMLEKIGHWEGDPTPAACSHLTSAWREAVRNHGPRCAIWSAGESITYNELDARVEHLASRLHEAGVGRGTAIASLLVNRKYHAIILLAAARVGAIHVPLDPALPEKRLQAIITDAEPILLISDDPTACQGFSLPAFPIDDKSGGTCTADISNNPLDILCLIYTSGSTGAPKGVMMIHGGVTNEAVGMAALAGIGPGDRVLQFASPGFDASLEEILATLLSGATLVPRPETLASDLDEFHRFILSSGITVLDLSTAYWAAWCAWMVSENESIPENIKTTIIGGERASAAAMRDWFAANGRRVLLANTYGPTEASIVATVELIGGDWKETGDPAIGRPLPGVLARVCDAAGRRLPPGAAGELWLGGVCVGSGYWQRPDLAEKVFFEKDGYRWYRTGDRVYQDDSGKLRFMGRQDDQLKIRGSRIEPSEVSRVIEGFPGVTAAHVGPVCTACGGVALAAWIRWNELPADGWPARIAAHAAAHLPVAAVPSRWSAVENFKLTERGKLDRASLPEPVLTASSQPSSEPPSTPTETRLAEFWADLLEVETVGRDDSFFDLGGHSLAALRLFAMIAREWKVRIPMAVLIQAPTLRLLGNSIDREVDHENPQASRDRSIVIPVKTAGHLTPLFCIHGGDGGVFCYQDLGFHLPSDRPLLAIESPALAMEGEVRPVSVEETAAAYVAQIRQHQPSGPYHLAGYSYGGLLVYEIARQLLLDGERIAFAGMFDTVNPAVRIREYSLMERMDVFWESQAHSSWLGKVGGMLDRACAGIATHLRVKHEIRSARTAGLTEPHSELRMLQVREAHWESMKVFEPQPLACHVTLFKSHATDDKFEIPDDYGWTGLVESLEIVEVPGQHLTMFSHRHVGTLAKEVGRRLRNSGETYGLSGL